MKFLSVKSLAVVLFVGVLYAQAPVQRPDVQSPVKQGEQQANVYSFNGWKAGTYNLSLVIGESGEIISVATLTVVSVPSPINTPISPIDPTPPTDTERVKRIKAAAPDDPETAKNIAGLAKVLATKARAGEFQTVQQLSDTFKTTMDFMLDDPVRKQKWVAVWERTADGSEGLIADEWIAVAQRGGTIADYTALLDDITVALGGSVQLEALDIQTIIEIVTIIMKGNLTPADYFKIIQLVLSLFS